MSADPQIQNAPRPMIAPHEIVMISATAAASWAREAATREVSLLEHDSAIAVAISTADMIANPRAWAAERVSLLAQPYATIPYYDAMPALGSSSTAARGWVLIPAIGIYDRPSDADAQKWWDALIAWSWRIADLTAESAQTTATPLPTDARPVAVFGEAAEATVTMPGRKFRENVEPALAGPRLMLGALAYLQARAGGLSAAQSQAAVTAMADAIALRDALAKEKAQVAERGTMRAVGTLGVALGAAYFYSRM